MHKNLDLEKSKVFYLEKIITFLNIFAPHTFQSASALKDTNTTVAGNAS